MSKTMAEVLAEHGEWRYTNGAGSAIVCRKCGAPVENVIEHQAAALSAAGFGLVADAIVIHVAHDTEAHARSFNEGYETAMAQELADDPTTAQDWLDAKLADAKAEALEEAADDMDGLELLSGYPEESCNDEENAAVEAYDNATNNQEWLRARAAALRGDS